MSRVLAVGSVAFDDLELPTGHFRDVWGGSASYASLAASLFTTIDLVAVVGEDFPEPYLDQLRKHGIRTEGVERVQGKSFRWAGRYDATLSSRVTLDTQLNVFANFRPKIPTISRKAPFVLLGNIHPALQLEVLEQVEAPKFVVADTMNFWITGERSYLNQLLKHIDVLVINEEEARQLGEHHNVTRATHRI